ncbi:MAG: hypothetical protein KAT75_04870, partial [Dehalococcoidia bacterium]|nr:hypothetical protein [Dehalococcoidia bacterium]
SGLYVKSPLGQLVWNFKTATINRSVTPPQLKPTGSDPKNVIVLLGLQDSLCASSMTAGYYNRKWVEFLCRANDIARIRATASNMNPSTTSIRMSNATIRAMMNGAKASFRRGFLGRIVTQRERAAIPPRSR